MITLPSRRLLQSIASSYSRGVVRYDDANAPYSLLLYDCCIPCC